MRTIAFIPVRGGSKTIPLKNIKPFCGKPLIYWAIKATEEVKQVDEIIVATDSYEIKSTVEKFSFSKVIVYDRNPENATDKSSTESVMLEFIENSETSRDDCFILIQATSPLLTSKDIENGLKKYRKTNFDSIVSCVEFKRFFWNKRGTPINYDYTDRPRRQNFKGYLMENGAFYINTVRNIVENKNRLSGNIGVSIMPEYTAYEIDEEEDWVIAESLMKRFIINKPKQDSNQIKLFVSDVDGVLTDSGMYYSEQGDELKKFNTKDGMAFQLLREQGIKTAIITSENTSMVKNRCKKLKIDYLYQGKAHRSKLKAVKEICIKEGITMNEVSYIGDDINCIELLKEVGFAACPIDAVTKVKNITGITILTKKGGQGVVREYFELLFKQ